MKLTIITVAYNSEQFFGECLDFLKSIKGEGNVECILIDGGSKDNTLMLAKKAGCFDLIVSEPDKGISHAFNKGVFLASSDYICFLNSDDYYNKDSFICLLNYLHKTNSDIIYCDSCQINGREKKLKKRYLGPGWISLPFTFGACVFKKKLFEIYGVFDINKKIAMDVDFVLRFWDEESILCEYLNKTLLVQRGGGVSDIQRVKGYIEYMKSAKSRYGSVLSCFGFIRKYMAHITYKYGLR
ncbi:glycosyltransferase [Plesiomonas shigelloides]|uniref:glycosyltransferase n=1 Tax=Plesiomonas shigelloides TaxID=703 RepID=UPI00387F2EAC